MISSIHENPKVHENPKELTINKNHSYYFASLGDTPELYPTPKNEAFIQKYIKDFHNPINQKDVVSPFIVYECDNNKDTCINEVTKKFKEKKESIVNEIKEEKRIRGEKSNEEGLLKAKQAEADEKVSNEQQIIRDLNKQAEKNFFETMFPNSQKEIKITGGIYQCFLPQKLQQLLQEFAKSTGIIRWGNKKELADNWRGFNKGESDITQQKGYFYDLNNGKTNATAAPKDTVIIPNVSKWDLANGLVAEGETSDNIVFTIEELKKDNGGGKRPTKTRNTIRAKKRKRVKSKTTKRRRRFIRQRNK